MKTRSIVLSILALSFASGSKAEVTQEIIYAYYSVRLLSGRSVGDSVRAQTPLGHTDNILAVGMANSTYTWTFTWQPITSGGCHVVGSHVTVKTLITLPYIVDERPGTAYEVRKFLDAIKTHELGHRDVAVKGAESIEQALMNTVASRCDKIAELANGAAQQRLQEAQAKQRYYDNDTHHGLTQGTALD